MILAGFIVGLGAIALIKAAIENDDENNNN